MQRLCQFLPHEINYLLNIDFADKFVRFADHFPPNQIKKRPLRPSLIFLAQVLTHEKVIRRPFARWFLGLLFPADVYCARDLFQNQEHGTGSGRPGFECLLQYPAFCLYSICLFLFFILFYIVPQIPATKKSCSGHLFGTAYFGRNIHTRLYPTPIPH